MDPALVPFERWLDETPSEPWPPTRECFARWCTADALAPQTVAEQDRVWGEYARNDFNGDLVSDAYERWLDDFVVEPWPPTRASFDRWANYVSSAMTEPERARVWSAYAARGFSVVRTV